MVNKANNAIEKAEMYTKKWQVDVRIRGAFSLLWFDWNNKYRLDYLIRYEKINSDLKNFIDSEKFYLEKFDYELNYKNKNPFKYNYKDYLCNISIDTINKLQNEDFSFFGYNKLT